jgi:hypothetical protein
MITIAREWTTGIRTSANPERWRAVASGVLFSLAVLLLEGGILPWTPVASLVSALILGGMALSTAPGPRPRGAIAFLLGVQLPLGLVLLLAKPPILLWQWWFVLLAFAGGAVREDDGPEAELARRELRVWALALAIYAGLFGVVPELVPWGAHVREVLIPDLLSAGLSRLAGQPLRVGGLMFGSSALAVVVCHAAAEAILLRKVRAPLRSAAVMVLVVTATVRVALVPALLRRGADLTWAPGIVGAATIAAWAIRTGLASAGGSAPAAATGGGKGPRLALVGAGVLAAMALNPGSVTPSPAFPKVLVLNEGGFDWEVAKHGKYGSFSGGMFGLLPYYVPGMTATSREGLGEALKRRPDVLLLINDHHLWSEPERDQVFDFVRGGGALLVLGDHTDVFGLMRGFNSLLEFTGLTFRFDAAYPTGGTFVGKARYAYHALASGWRTTALGTAIGASLDIRPPWRPLLIGRYVLSDAGMRGNWMGSLLGNYTYDPGERYGDLAIVAERTLGRGRIMVFGDTSMFQNGSLSDGTRTTVYPVLRSLATPVGGSESPALRAAAASLLVLAVVAVGLLGADPAAGAALCLAFLAAGLVGERLNSRRLNAEVPIPARTVLIDRWHAPLTGHYEAGRNSVGPLYNNLVRAALLPVDLDDWDDEAIARSAGIVVIEPTRPLDESEAARLRDYLGRGGTVVFAGDAEAGERWSRLFDPLGIRISDIALGRLPPRDPAAESRDKARLDLSDVPAGDESRGKGTDAETPTSAPTFPCGWQLLFDQDPSVEPLFQVSGRCVAAAKKVGAGALVVIGDPRVFSSQNVEDTWGYATGTLRWIALLFEKYLHGDLRGFPEKFEVPAKPRDEDWR